MRGISADTVKRIKERVEEKEGIPPQQQVSFLNKRLFRFQFGVYLFLKITALDLWRKANARRQDGIGLQS